MSMHFAVVIVFAVGDQFFFFNEIVKTTEACSVLCPQDGMKDGFHSTCLF